MAASDKELNIGIKVTSDTAGAKQATTAIGGVTDAIQDQTAATNQLAAATARATEQAQQFISDNAYGKFDDTLARAHDAMRKTTVSANGATDAKKRLTQAEREAAKASTQSAMGLMALSNAFQDVQYGMAGMINNIPGIVTGMGLGMGIAGAVQAAAVGVQILTKNFDLFGTEAKAAAKEATEVANEADALEASTIRLSATTAEAAKKQKDLAAALKETKTEYDAIALSANQAIEAAQRFQDIETKRADLQSDLALAEVDVQLASGQIGMGDATAKRAGIRAQRDARAAALAEKTLTATQKAEEQKAKAAEAAAKAQERILKTKLDEDLVTGMMTKEQREIATKALDAAEKGAVSAQKRLATYLKEQNERSDLRDTLASGGIPLPVSKEEAARVAQIQKTTGLVQSRLSRAQRLRGELAQDAAAQDISGFKTLEAFQAERSKVSTDVIGLQSQAMEARKKAGFAGENLGLARETTAVRSRIASLTQSSAAAAAAQSGYGIGFTGPIPPQGFAVDQKESEKAAREADKEAKELARETVKIVRSLAAGLKFSKEEIAGLAAMVDDLRTSK